MTKILFSAILISLIPLNGWACRPEPLPECLKKSTKVNISHFEGLIIQVEDYQKILDGSISRPTSADSCFNNHFATHYAKLLKGELSMAKGWTCQTQISLLKLAITKLIDPGSPENQHVSNQTMRKVLKQNARKIKIGLGSLP